MTPIRVLLVDDQALFRAGLRLLLSAQPELDLVGEAADGAEAVRLAAALRPQVVLMDVRMPTLDGVAATRRLRAEVPECRVVLLTTFDDDAQLFAGLRAGAVGYLLKDATPEALVEAVRAAAAGAAFLPPAVTAKVVAEFARLTERGPVPGVPPVEPLSTRELEVLRLVACGATNRAIADRLFIGEGTVKNHLTSILAKLGVADRTQAALKARDLGLV